ncbi:molecular chaperone GroES [candidate division MSBL1 archaeon SCGC-AAA382A20]|uniref:Molecular chaperone GroES n=1 Tax=candidate division MSBL1 archaeon SCGC-AAA382A20 TaxID=1698280 RepID=A0A133VMF1_9EURY|nr:molecular chaperone GroES [candidate division MSBL1 archaeon SCGC-AAA382A20]
MTAKAKGQINIKPLDDRIVIEPVEGEDKTAGGIFLPDTAKEKPQQGKVVALGPGRMLDNGERSDMPVSVGDRVLHSKYGGTEVKVNGQDVMILQENDVLAIIED